MPEKQAESNPEWLIALRAALDGLPRDYPHRHQELIKIRHAVHREIAAALQGPLNEHLQALPQNTFVEKQQIATAVNNDLRMLNLCLRYSTATASQPAILVADYRDDETKNSRFRLLIDGPRGTHLRKNASARVPMLELQESPPREEVFASRFSSRKGGDTTPPR